jgi:cell division septation protein DedD
MAGRNRKSLLVCVFALALAGCGSSNDGTIPPSDADTLLTDLAAVQSDVAAGNCDFAKQHAQEFVDAVNALPSDVDPKVSGELTKAALNLDALASDPGQCATGATGETTTESTTSTTETSVPTESTTSEPTTTTTEQETTTISPPDEEPNTDPNQQPPGGGQDQGGQVGGGGLEPPTGGVAGGGGGGPG